MSDTNIIHAIPLSKQRLLVCFEDRTLYELDVCRAGKASFPTEPQVFEQAEVEPQGQGVSWPDGSRCSGAELRRLGQRLPLALEDLIQICRSSIISTTEATKLLGCTRQNIDNLVHRGKLTPIKSYPKNTLFLKSDVMNRLRLNTRPAAEARKKKV